jgi:methylenetetrahydrofolate--tRNA-(uracil-5-)-methyltransferase
VNRDLFSEEVTRMIKTHPNITVTTAEISEIDPLDTTIIATGPLTSDKMSETISKMIGGAQLHFYDAAAPVVTNESIDHTKIYKASRYGKGTDDYINCPMNAEEYARFYEALISAKTEPQKDFEGKNVFEGCMPIEIMAARGPETLCFGPLKPIGLNDPKTGKMPHAVVQLRMENAEGTLYNLVGFQTNLKFGEQKRVFGMIPGLENAEFVRYGVMHRNTYIQSPGLLDATYRLISNPNVYFAGQMTGVEGYIESASSGLVAGINAAIRQKVPDFAGVNFPPNTSIGALAHYISGYSGKDFQPMNVNFGIFSGIDIPRTRNKRERYAAYAESALTAIRKIPVFKS